MPAWDDFFLAQAGASASLAGLLFVGISLNMKRIIAVPALPNVALRALGLFATVFVVSSVMLVPGQTNLAVGIELLVAVAGSSFVITWLTYQVLRLSEVQYLRGSQAGLVAILTVSGVYLGGALFILDGLGTGVYLLVGPAIASILLALMDSWVLLIEINR